MVGGRDYRQSQFNRAVQAKRQPGSAFKLFVYLAAMRQGGSPDLTVLDTPLTVGDWSPQNYESEYAGGPITLRQAFARSSNVAAVRLAQQAGLRNVARAARDLGVKGELPNNPTLALGTSETTLLDLTAAYAGVAAGQAPVQPHGVAGMEPRGRTRRLRDTERRAMLDLLRAVVTSGTGRAANLSVPAFGKTGTSQDYRDAWFIGFAGDLVVGVWIGNDDNSPMRNVAGGGLPTQVWRDFMGYALSRGDFGGGVEFEEPERGLEIFPQDDDPAADPFLPEGPAQSDPEVEPLFREDEVVAPPPPGGGPLPGPAPPQPAPPPLEPVEVEEAEVEDEG
jgi:penicillin-binding protein 1A